MSGESKTPEFDKLAAVKVPTTRALLATHAPELLPSQLAGGYTWDNANAPLFVGPFVSMVDAGKALAKDIAAIEERHAEEIAALKASEQLGADALQAVVDENNILRTRHADEIAQIRREEREAIEDAAKDVADLGSRQVEMIKQARREAYEEVAKMIEDDAESAELQHAGGHPDLQIILKATEITREVAGFIREKAGKL